jgi:HlyD family secretion protein
MGTVLETPEQPIALPNAATEPPGSLATRWRPGRQLKITLVVVLLATATLLLVEGWPRLFAPAAVPTLRASGRIEGREVTLSPKTIQGRVKRLLADEGDTVAQGALVAELDAAQLDTQVAAAAAAVSNLDAQVRQAQLDVDYTARSTDASIAAAEAAVDSARALVARANAVQANATASHERARALLDDAVISRQEFDAAEMALRTSRADVVAADTEVARAEAGLRLARTSADAVGLKRQQLRALVESRRTAAARLDEARTNIAERLIHAPSSGTIVSRLVEVGDVVSPGTPLFQLVDMSRLYVKVYIPEADIGRLRLDDGAEIYVDAFPGHAFRAHVSKIHDQAEFTPKNVETAEERLKLVFGVELAIDNADGVLKPGMPADCVIHWTRTGTDATGHGE